jgi:3-methylfumaryl-CoA hydratase
MKSKLASAALLSLVSGLASAAPCHDVVGTWRITLACVAQDPPPRFGTRESDGVITAQEGCVFAGMIGDDAWVGALAGDGNRTVHSDFGGAKVGELSRGAAPVHRDDVHVHVPGRRRCAADGLHRDRVAPLTVLDPAALRDWIGRTERRVDRVTRPRSPRCRQRSTATIRSRARAGGAAAVALAVLHAAPPQHDIGPDGHAEGRPAAGPVAAAHVGGSRIADHPLTVGDEIVRTSRIADVVVKEGRSGTLVFVTVEHQIADPTGIAIREAHDIVYRDLPGGSAKPSAAPLAPTNETYKRAIVPDPVLLFRYSALTFNSHRIHYDRSYVTGVEGYPGLVVHGPLIATLLLDNLRRHVLNAHVRRFEFKAVHPLFDIEPFEICGREESARAHALWARDARGALAMQATVELG